MSSEYVSINVKRPTHKTLQALQLRLSADVGRRLTVTDIVAVALDITERHHAEAIAALAPHD